MNSIFEQYLDYIKAVKNFSAATIASYKNDLKLFDEWLDECEVPPLKASSSDIRIFASEMSGKNFSPSSINRMLSSLRSFYRYCMRFKLCSANPAVSVRNFKAAKKIPVFMFPEEAESFYSLPEKGKILWAARDTALFACLYSTGCRVSELAALNMEDFDSSFSSASVFGKGRKERKVFFADFARERLKEYFKEREILLAKKNRLNGEKKQNAVFLNLQGKPLTRRGIAYIIKRYTLISRGTKNLSPHAFRHSFASALVTKGADIRVVQELLGHENISTTQRYTHITPERLHKLYKEAHPHS